MSFFFNNFGGGGGGGFPFDFDGGIVYVKFQKKCQTRENLQRK